MGPTLKVHPYLKFVPPNFKRPWFSHSTPLIFLFFFLAFFFEKALVLCLYSMINLVESMGMKDPIIFKVNSNLKIPTLKIIPSSVIKLTYDFWKLMNFGEDLIKIHKYLLKNHCHLWKSKFNTRPIKNQSINHLH